MDFLVGVKKVAHADKVKHLFLLDFLFDPEFDLMQPEKPIFTRKIYLIS